MPRPRITTRELILVVIIIALILAWGIERRQVRRLTWEARAYRAMVEYERAMKAPDRYVVSDHAQ
jgi:hypothetical protein